MELAERIADYTVSLQYSDLSTKTIDSAKRLLVDTFGCAVGAAKEKPIEIALKSIPYRYREQETSSSILLSERKTSPHLAAFVNGAMARYFDYNDTYDSQDFSHPSDNIMPVLAVAEAEHRSGREALLGMILAYQLQCRLVDSVALWRKGWDHVNNGLVSVAAAASRLMGSNREQTAQAINIALSSNLTIRQVREDRISMWKAFSFSNAARNAILSSYLAHNGMEGPSPVFEGKSGYFKEVSGAFKLELPKKDFRINDAIIKHYPAEIRAQSAISCARGMRKEFDIKDVESILIRTTEGGYRILGSDREKWAPKNKETADHSLPYVVATVIVDGKLDVSSYTPAKLNDKRTLGLMKKTKVEIAKEFVPKDRDVHIEANEVIVTLKNGRVMKRKLFYPRGHPKNPLNEHELAAKFANLCKRNLSEKKRDALMDVLQTFEKVKDVGRVFDVTK